MLGRKALFFVAKIDNKRYRCYDIINKNKTGKMFMIKFVLLLLPVFLGVFVFVYFFLRRSLRAFSLDTSNIKVKIALIAISLALTLLSFNISSMLTVFLLHLMGIDLFLRLVVFIFNKVIKPKETKIFNNLKKIYKSGIVSILAVAVLLVFGYFNLQNVKATEYSISTNKDIRDEGYRVLLIADMHYGVSLDFDELTRKCAEMSEFDPDIVVLCGDIVDNGTSPEEMQALFKALGGIKSKYGIFYVYGNHDRSMRLLESEFGDDDLQKAITDNGIKILRDEVITLNDEFTVVGREDRSRERKTVFELQKDIDENDYVLVLDHQPSEYAENAKGKTNLVLSGHTHAGQFFPVNYLLELVPFNDGVYGMYDIDDDTKAIVTSGFAGWAYPSKTSSPAEYAVIDIKPQ